MDDRGWIKLYRKFNQWGWKSDPNMVALFVHLLLNANHEKKEWKGITVERGQMVTGLRSLTANTGISIRTLRTCLERLKSTHEVTIKSTHKYSIITLLKWDTYQLSRGETDTENDTVIDIQPTHNRHTTDNKQEVKNVRSIYLPLFEEFWKTYPNRNGKKVGKKECFDYFCKSFNNGDRQLVITACCNYANSKTAREGFAKDPIRFLKKDFWRDWLEAPKKKNEGEWL